MFHKKSQEQTGPRSAFLEHLGAAHFWKFTVSAQSLVVLLWVQCMYTSILLKKTLDTPLFSFILLGIPSSLICFVKNKRVGWQNVFADNPCYIKTLIVIPDWLFGGQRSIHKKLSNIGHADMSTFKDPESLHCLCPSIILEDIISGSNSQLQQSIPF